MKQQRPVSTGAMQAHAISEGMARVARAVWIGRIGMAGLSAATILLFSYCAYEAYKESHPAPASAPVAPKP